MRYNRCCGASSTPAPAHHARSSPEDAPVPRDAHTGTHSGKTVPAGSFDRYRAGAVVVPSHSGDGATHSIDTLTTARDLEAAGIERKHAEAIATAIGRADEQAASKADLAALRADTKGCRSRIDIKKSS